MTFFGIISVETTKRGSRQKTWNLFHGLCPFLFLSFLLFWTFFLFFPFSLSLLQEIISYIQCAQGILLLAFGCCVLLFRNHLLRLSRLIQIAIPACCLDKSAYFLFLIKIPSDTWRSPWARIYTPQKNQINFCSLQKKGARSFNKSYIHIYVWSPSPTVVYLIIFHFGHFDEWMNRFSKKRDV